MDLHLPGGFVGKSLGWLYWLQNPLMPFIWYRVAIPHYHPDLEIERFKAGE